MKYFKPGDLVPIEIGGEAKVIKKLGEGGQGVVYSVEYQGKQYALKWYFKGRISNENEFRQNLAQNVSDGPPSPKFLWPLFLATPSNESFGYLMELRPGGYSSFPDILNALVNFASTEALINTALNLINAFRDLHRVGKSYQDLNDGGFFIRMDDGDVLICDCDNVAPYGVSLGIAGKPGYMAPEVVRGESRPSMNTDKYSLGVILFKLLMRSDPLEGKRVIEGVCITEAAEKKHYGTDPLFIFDPANPANRPVRGVHNNAIRFWGRFPAYIQEAFVRAFTEGLMNPTKRLPDNEWQKIFVRFKSDLVICPSCGKEGFLSAYEKAEDKIACPACKKQYDVPMQLVFKSYKVPLFPGVNLYQYHTDSDSSDISSEDYLTKTAVVIQNPKDPTLLGLRNIGTSQWFIKRAEGDFEPLEPGKVARILPGTQITFKNKLTAEIV